MNNFENEVQYFIDLVFNNMQTAKTKKGKIEREEAVFKNINISKNGEEVAVWDMEKDYAYILKVKEIEDFEFKEYLTKHLALYYIDILKKYEKNEITFEEFADIPKETNPVVKDIIKQKENVSEQLKLLRSHRNLPEVEEYIDELYNYKYASPYMKYLIDKYYYNKKDLVKPEKNGLERMFKIILQ